MKKTSLILVVCALLSSCATLTHSRMYKVRISSNVQGAKVKINNDVLMLPATVTVERSKNDLPLVLEADTLKRSYVVKSSPSNAFVFGNLVWTMLSPFAYLIDLSSSKRFYYGNRIYLNKYSDDSVVIADNTPLEYISRQFSDKTGQLRAGISNSLLNAFYQQPPLEASKSNAGFGGLSAGLEYFYSDTRYLALNGCFATDFIAPMGALDYYGEWDLMESRYISLTNNIKVKRFSFGYGLNYAENCWSHLYSFDGEPPLRDPVSRESKAIGITLNGYHQISRNLFAGILYRPTLLRIKPDVKLKYEHLISLDFAFKFCLVK